MRTKINLLRWIALIIVWFLSACAKPPLTESTSDVVDNTTEFPTLQQDSGQTIPSTGNWRFIQLTEQDAAVIGQKVWLNESAGRVEGLTAWNVGENFASLGIGHFIWYPSSGQPGRFQETFPAFLLYLQQQRIALPGWLQNTPHNPWNSREEFLRDMQSNRMISLRNLLKNTLPQQAQFMIKRAESALGKMLANLSSESQQAKIRERFYRIAKTPQGVYVLIDYINFKGEGVLVTERYHEQGWGLLQVLEAMSDDADNVLHEFARAAELVIMRRVQNSPTERNESQWLSGWRNRINTYRL